MKWRRSIRGAPSQVLTSPNNVKAKARQRSCRDQKSGTICYNCCFKFVMVSGKAAGNSIMADSTLSKDRALPPVSNVEALLHRDYLDLAVSQKIISAQNYPYFEKSEKPVKQTAVLQKENQDLSGIRTRLRFCSAITISTVGFWDGVELPPGARLLRSQRSA